jgi:hypothetical protein
MPDKAEAQERAELAAIVAVGKEIDRRVAALPRARSRILLSLRASIVVISGQLSEFASYFDRPLA